MTPTQMIDFR